MTDIGEPTFRIEILACSWAKLNMVELNRKLKLMHDLGLTKFYTIVEDTNSIPEPSAKPPPNK